MKLKMPTCGHKHIGCNRNQDIDPITGLCRPCLYLVNNPPGATSAQGYLGNFPPAAMATASKVNMDTINKVAEQVNKGEEVDTKECMVAMFGLVASLHNQNSEAKVKIDAIGNRAVSNEKRIDDIEKKIGGKEECAIPLSVTIQNLSKYPTVTDEESVKKVIAEIGADGVDPESDVVKVNRKGYKPASGTQQEKLGTVMVELSSLEVKAKIMRAKKCLENRPNNLANLRIRNMKSQAELNQEFFNRQVLKLVPGGERFYIAANGALRPQQPRHAGPQGHPPHGQRPPPFRPSTSSFRPGALPQQQQPQQQQQLSVVPMPGLHPPGRGIYSQPPPAPRIGENLLPDFMEV